MRILMSWLGEMVETPDDPRELADRITDIGLEVEEILRLDEQISKVQVAQVVATENHPDHSHLTVCEIESDGTTGQIVTAAPAVREGRQYLWAIPGATLPGQEVERRDFQGVDSEGMLVSSRELGLTRDAQTLLTIPDQYESGDSAIDVLRLDEPILELDLTPNRPDCLSHLGVARDFAAAEGLDLNDPRPDRLPDGSETDVEIIIEAEEDCWSYTGVPVAGVNVTHSPFEIKKRLLKMGLRPLNNIVDVTNYTLFEVGHPLHPFDYDRMVSPVTVRRAEVEELLRTLDGETHELTDKDLVIADKHGPQALAGIMGGINAQVERATERILLEGAYFNPTRIRRTASRMKLHTEASHRFERGCDPVEYDRAIARCLELMAEDPAQDDEFTIFDPVSTSVHTPETTSISFAPTDFPEQIGFDPGEEQMKQQLQKLGMELEEAEEGWSLTPPSWRPDLSRPADLLEEIVRLHGYEKIPVSHPSLPLDQTVQFEPSIEQSIREFLSARGLYEAITYSFVGEDEHRFGEDNGEPIFLENPLSRHTKTMRTDILTNLVNTWNENQDRDGHGFFEIGPVFPPGEDEHTKLGFVLGGDRDIQRWDEPGELDFYGAAGLVEALVRHLGAGEISVTPTTRKGFHEHRCGELELDGETIGVLGQVEDDQLEDTDIPLLAGHLNLNSLRRRGDVQFQPYSTQPIVKRDLDLVVDRDQYVEPLRETIREQAQWLETIRIFDVYQGEPLPSDKKSVSFNFSFRHPDKTLDDEAVNEVQQDIFEALQNEYGATLRSE